MNMPTSCASVIWNLLSDMVVVVEEGKEGNYDELDEHWGLSGDGQALKSSKNGTDGRTVKICVRRIGMAYKDGEGRVNSDDRRHRAEATSPSGLDSPEANTLACAVARKVAPG